MVLLLIDIKILQERITQTPPTQKVGLKNVENKIYATKKNVPVPAL